MSEAIKTIRCARAGRTNYPMFGYKLSNYYLLAAAIVAAIFVARPSLAQEFRPCDDAQSLSVAGSLCTVTKLPLRPDHRKIDKSTIDLFVRKFPVADRAKRRGEIWLVAGGPGESGASFFPVLSTLQRAFPGFDLVIADHRGTGYSSKLCPEQEAPASADGIGLANKEWAPCIAFMQGNLNRTHSFTVTNAAYDLSALISRYRGKGELYVYGVSYGTQLVLRMMQAAPVQVDGIILDGLVPPDNASQWDLSHRSQVVDAVGRKLLTADETRLYQTLLSRRDSSWRARVPHGDLQRFMGSLLSFPQTRERIPAIIDALAVDDVQPLMDAAVELHKLSGSLATHPQSPPSLPLVMLISGSENNDRPRLTATIVAAEARDALFTSALPGLLAKNPAPLYQRDRNFGKLPKKLPRTLIIHGTLDPNTPYDGARAHADLIARTRKVDFTTVEGGAHFLALVAAECFVDATSTFVARAQMPAECNSSSTAVGRRNRR